MSKTTLKDCQMCKDFSVDGWDHQIRKPHAPIYPHIYVAFKPVINPLLSLWDTQEWVLLKRNSHWKKPGHEKLHCVFNVYGYIITQLKNLYAQVKIGLNIIFRVKEIKHLKFWRTKHHRKKLISRTAGATAIIFNVVYCLQSSNSIWYQAHPFIRRVWLYSVPLSH